MSTNNRALLCMSLVLSQLNYADVVYGPFLSKLENLRLQRIQNSCIRLIFGLRKYDHISAKFKVLKWLNIKQRRDLHICCLLHKILLQKSPPYLLNKLRYRTDVHNINVRNKKLLTIPAHRTSAYHSSFSYFATKYYNKIPAYLKSLSLNKFKKGIKEQIASWCFRICLIHR